MKVKGMAKPKAKKDKGPEPTPDPGAYQKPVNPHAMPEWEKEVLAQYFKVRAQGHKDSPCTVLDRHGRIIVWYLPDIIHPLRVVSPQNN